MRALDILVQSRRDKAAAQKGSRITVSGIARQAGVDRTFLYRHRDLLALVHAAELEPAERDPASGTPAVSRASLQADLANAQTRTSACQHEFSSWRGACPGN